MIRRTLLGAVVGAAAFGSLLAAAAAPTRIGEINSCARVPAFLLSDHKGWELAVEVRALRPRS